MVKEKNKTGNQKAQIICTTSLASNQLCDLGQVTLAPWVSVLSPVKSKDHYNKPLGSFEIYCNPSTLCTQNNILYVSEEA